MTPKKWVVAVLAVLVGSPFAVHALSALGVGPGFHVEAPEWQAGYEWTFDTRSSTQVASRFGAEREQGSVEMRGESQIGVVNTTLTMDDVPVYAVVEQFRPKTVRVDGELVFDAERDNESSNPAGGYELGCVFQCPGDFGFRTRADLNPFFPGNGAWGSEEIHLLDFPLERKTWTVARDQPDEGHEDEPFFHIEASAVGMEYVKLPVLGVVEAVRIEAGLTRASQASVKEALMEDEVPGLDLRMDLGYTITYWYAPSMQQVVRSEADMFFEVRGSFEGQTIEHRESTRGVESLVAYSLEPGRERSLDEIRRMQRVLDDLPEVRELSDEAWPFAVAADKFHVDAVAGGTIALGLLAGEGGGDVVAERFDSVPEGFQVAWRHRYFETTEHGLNPTTERYAGGTLELAISDQGLHEVTAYVLDAEGRLVGADQLMLEGRGSWTKKGAVDAGLLGFPDRTTMAFETSAFLQQLDVRIDPGPSGWGDATLRTPDGEEVRFVAMGETKEEVKVDPSTWGEWDLEYSDLVRVGALSISADAIYNRSLDISAYFGQQAAAYQPEQVGDWSFGASTTDDCVGLSALCRLAAASGALPEQARLRLAG